MKQVIVLLAIALMVAVGCSSDKSVTYEPIEEPNPYLTVMSVDSIGQDWYPTHSSDWRYVKVVVYGNVASPCWEYSHIETSRIGFNYYVKVFVARNSAEACPADTSVISPLILITLSSDIWELPDSVFFWQGESTYLEVEYTGGGII